MIYINVSNFVLINKLEKDHSMIETSRLENVVIFFVTISSFALSRKNNKVNYLLPLPITLHYVLTRNLPNLIVLDN